MRSSIIPVIYVVAMVALIVGLDVALFRNHVWARLALNVGIALVFGAFYLRFGGPSGSPRI